MLGVYLSQKSPWSGCLRLLRAAPAGSGDCEPQLALGDGGDQVPGRPRRLADTPDSGSKLARTANTTRAAGSRRARAWRWSLRGARATNAWALLSSAHWAEQTVDLVDDEQQAPGCAAEPGGLLLRSTGDPGPGWGLRLISENPAGSAARARRTLAASSSPASPAIHGQGGSSGARARAKNRHGHDAASRTDTSPRPLSRAALPREQVRFALPRDSRYQKKSAPFNCRASGSVSAWPPPRGRRDAASRLRTRSAPAGVINHTRDSRQRWRHHPVGPGQPTIRIDDLGYRLPRPAHPWRRGCLRVPAVFLLACRAACESGQRSSLNSAVSAAASAGPGRRSPAYRDRPTERHTRHAHPPCTSRPCRRRLQQVHEGLCRRKQIGVTVGAGLAS